MPRRRSSWPTRSSRPRSCERRWICRSNASATRGCWRSSSSAMRCRVSRTPDGDAAGNGERRSTGTGAGRENVQFRRRVEMGQLSHGRSRTRHAPTRAPRAALSAVSLLVICAVVAACGGGGGKSSTSAKNDKSAAGTTITWWDYFGYSKEGNQAIDGMIAQYEKTHPGVKIKRTSYAYPDFFTKFNQTVATNHTPDIAA